LGSRGLKAILRRGDERDRAAVEGEAVGGRGFLGTGVSYNIVE